MTAKKRAPVACLSCHARTSKSRRQIVAGVCRQCARRLLRVCTNLTPNDMHVLGDVRCQILARYAHDGWAFVPASSSDRELLPYVCPDAGSFVVVSRPFQSSDGDGAMIITVSEKSDFVMRARICGHDPDDAARALFDELTMRPEPITYEYLVRSGFSYL